MISEKVNRSEILAETKRLLRERSNEEVNDVEAEKISQNGIEFFNLLLQWNGSSSEDIGLGNVQ